MNRPLENKKALITGASKGLGQAIAIALAEAGAEILLVSRDLSALESVRTQIQSNGNRARTFTADVTREPDILQLEQTIRSQAGPIDILINNAGINIRKPTTEFSLEEWNRVLNTNLTGAFLMCRAFIPQLQGKNYGRIINMTSMMSHVALPGRTAYAASKFGLLGFTKALALELAADHITVNGISPGPFATEMNKPIFENPDTRKYFMDRLPVQRFGTVEEIGKLAVYICSPEAGFLTGSDIVIDGGWTAQ